MDLMRRMHRPLRQSGAPYLRAFLGAMERGLGMMNLRGFAAGLYLDSASERDLQEWADAYVIDTSGLTDAQARAKIKAEALTRNRTTEEAIETAILDQTGYAAAVRPTLPHVAHYDDQERMEGGYRMADYARFTRQNAGIPWGGKWSGKWPSHQVLWTEDDPTHLGYRGLTPRREVFGPDGFIVYLARPYDETLEAQVLAILNEQAPAMSAYTLFWAHHFDVAVTDHLTLRDQETRNPTRGWGWAPWGRAWGNPHVRLRSSDQTPE